MSSEVIHNLLKDAIFPKMVHVRQNFPREKLFDFTTCIEQSFDRHQISSTIMRGMKIAVTCGSRGIANISEVIRDVCAAIKKYGGEPFIVPAMGSHGGATPEGQVEILHGYGVTEEFCGAPIVSSMDVLVIGETDDGCPVYMDRVAAHADGIVIVGRIKSHTDFRGEYESGLLKMAVVGLGKQQGAEIFHHGGPEHMAENLLRFGKVVLDKAPILFGCAIIENAYGEIASIELIPRAEILDKEPILLQEAKKLMAKSYIQSVDVLIVDQIGKDISGDGMDPNITGRFSNPHVSGGMEAKKMVILDITHESQGQMVGLGYGDVTTQRCLDKCDFDATYPNALTSTTFSPFRVPIVLQSDREAIAACLKYCGNNDAENPRVIRIRDTLHMQEILVSEALMQEVEDHPHMEIVGELEEFVFDEKGNLF